jgi:hypothetical protein
MESRGLICGLSKGMAQIGNGGILELLRRLVLLHYYNYDNVDSN